MSDCICSSCRNLKGIIDENGAVEVYECVYGYPSEKCDSCESGECELSCANYINDENEEGMVVVRCATCGRELHKMYSDKEEGRYQCIECFLKESN